MSLGHKGDPPYEVECVCDPGIQTLATIDGVNVGGIARKQNATISILRNECAGYSFLD